MTPFTPNGIPYPPFQDSTNWPQSIPYLPRQDLTAVTVVLTVVTTWMCELTDMTPDRW